MNHPTIAERVRDIVGRYTVVDLTTANLVPLDSLLGGHAGDAICEVEETFGVDVGGNARGIGRPNCLLDLISAVEARLP